ncbi:maltose ABC transporter substrate-binding protein [Actinotalea sp. M2MS4P-6]|uniref:sugar ABC transporter substrate-binding protein n=1 Tax=Actinotalea sp. M2MS4P-6 TaxID=2983762 RepID=UPI0021E4626F|nr:maltose ABC transporter substrate-binding protein [Actinotalea sp. M2MS4P-6]MCV2392808.1 maltose ABC transporter substrate-binding protein [Actinotalea sp. M2MS4P-6]
MRRIPRGLAVAAGVGLLLTACSGGTSEEPSASDTTTTDESSSPALEGTLTIWADETRVDDVKTIAEAYTEQSGVQVDVIQKASTDIGNDFITSVPTGEGPDIIVSAHDGLGGWVTNGVVGTVDLGDKAGEFSDAAVKAMTYDGQVYGVPYAIENIALIRNNAIIQDTPDTWDAMVTAAQATGAKYPIVIQQDPTNGDPYHLYPLQTSFGAPVFATENGSYTNELAMGGPEGTAFAEFLAAQGAAGILDTNISADVAKEAFLNGEAAYIITGPWYVSDFTAANMDISVLPIPSAGGQPAQPFVGVQGFFPSINTENPLLVNDFLVNFIATPEVQTQFYELQGRVPAMTAAAEGLSDPILLGFNEAGASGAPMPAIPEMSAVWEWWGAAEADIISGKAPADERWATMITNIQSAIGG